MNNGVRDLAQTRMRNAMLLFDEFVHATIKHADAATLRGLEGRFAERLQIQPSYWSQIKSRSRQIGERLARQFERLCHKPVGWMDQPHAPASWSDNGLRSPAAPMPRVIEEDDGHRIVPQDDDERFIVSLVLSYYRRHPQRAKTRLLDLLGEVLAPPPSPPVAPVTKASSRDDGRELWTRTRANVAPLKKKR